MSTPHYQMVRVENLLTTKHYGTQRIEGVSEARARKMAANFDLAKAGVITVSKRPDGSMFVADGAHRSTAARMAGVEFLPALVHTGLDHEAEAALFYSLNDFKAPSPVSKFLARVDKGDRDAVLINHIVRDHGWKIASGSDNGIVSAVTALEDIYRRGCGPLKPGEHPGIVDWTFDVITDAWGHDRDASMGAILKGVALLTARFGAGVDSTKLVSEMQQIRPKQLIGQAHGWKDYHNGNLHNGVAAYLVGLHNKRRRKDVLPEWVWTR